MIAPKANPDSTVVPFNTGTGDVKLTGNDTFLEYEYKSGSLVFGEIPEGWEVVAHADGTATAQPKPGFVGTVEIPYTVSNTADKTASSVWTITVEKPSAPTAESDTFDVPFGSTAPVTVSLADLVSVPEGSTVDWSSVSVPAEDTNFTYELVNGGRDVKITPKHANRAGVAPAVEFTVADIYGQQVSGTITGTFSSPEIAVAIDSTVNGEGSAVVVPGQPQDIKHVVVNISEHTIKAGTPVTVNGVVHEIARDVAPGEKYEFTTQETVGQKETKTVSSSVTFTLEVIDATSSADRSLTAGATDTVSLVAKTGEIKLVDDVAETLFRESVVIDVFGNDSFDPAHPLLDSTFRFEPTEGGVIEDGRIVFDNGSYTFIGNGQVRWDYAPGATKVAIPSVKYSASNELGDVSDPANISVNAKTVAPTVSPDSFSVPFNSVESFVVPIKGNDLIPDGAEVTFEMEHNGEWVSSFEDDNAVYKVTEDGIKVNPKPGRTGKIADIKYRAVDQFGQSAETVVSGEFGEPVTSVALESWIGEPGVTSVDVKPGTEVTVNHKVTNTSAFPYTLTGIEILVDGEVVNVDKVIEPGETFEWTSVVVADKSGKVGASVEVSLDAVDALTGKSRAVSASASSEVSFSVYSLSLKVEIEDDKGVWHDANSESDAVSFDSVAERKHKFTITNTGDVEITEVDVVDANGNLVTITLDKPLAPGESVEAVESFEVPEGKYSNEWSASYLDFAVSDGVNAVVTLPEPEPTPVEPTPEPVKSIEKTVPAPPVQKKTVVNSDSAVGDIAVSSLAFTGLAGLASVAGVRSVMKRRKG